MWLVCMSVPLSPCPKGCLCWMMAAPKRCWHFTLMLGGANNCLLPQTVSDYANSGERRGWHFPGGRVNVQTGCPWHPMAPVASLTHCMDRFRFPGSYHHQKSLRSSCDHLSVFSNASSRVWQYVCAIGESVLWSPKRFLSVWLLSPGWLQRRPGCEADQEVRWQRAHTARWQSWSHQALASCSFSGFQVCSF